MHQANRRSFGDSIGKTTEMRHPSLVVFDLDLTLWECGSATWCDCLSPPFERVEQRVVDRRGNPITLYDDVPSILDELDTRGIPMALASRTHEPGWARELLSLLGIEHRFAFAEIYPAAKFSHFSSLRDDSGFDFEDMLFFDDEHRNIRDINQLGVTCVHVANGMATSVLESALASFE